MKRALFLLSAILFLAGCTEFNDVDKPNCGGEEANPLTSIYAGFADEDSRTYVENDVDVLWQNGDALSLFYSNCRNVKFEYNGDSGVSEAKFDFVPETGVLGDKNLKHLETHGLYPYYKDAATEYDEASNSFNISTLLPITQHYAPDSFGCGANVMVAASRGHYNELKDGPLYFRNACGYFTVKLYGEGVKVRSITLMARNGESLAGDATIRTHVNEAPVVTMAPGGSNYITLDCGAEGVELGTDKENATEFWFALPPMTLNNGVHLRVTATDGTIFKMETAKKIVIERNKIQPMAALKFVSNYNVLLYTRHTKRTIPFEWGTGEKYFDAKITAHYYDPEKKHIVVEFATPLTTIKEKAFYEIGEQAVHKDLETITFPNSLTTIEKDSFYNTGLVRLDFPGSLTCIGADAFLLCYKLKSVTFEPSPTSQPVTIKQGGKGPLFQDGSLIYINVNRAFKFILGEEEVEPSGAFYGLFGNIADGSYSTKIVIGEQVPKIYNYMFARVSVDKIDIPDHITEIGKGAFYACKNLAEFTVPATVKSIGGDAFFGCTSLNTISIENSDEPLTLGYTYSGSDEYGPFYNSPLKNIYMGRDIIQVDSNGNHSEADGWEEGIFVNANYDEEDMVLNVEIGPKVTKIWNYMFNYMKIGSITISEGVASIGKLAFRSCKKLASLTIPASVKTIGYDAFYDCSDLKTLVVKDSDTQLKIGYTYKGLFNTDEHGPFYDSPLTNIYCGRNFALVDGEGYVSPADAWEEGIFSNCGYEDETLTVNLTIGPKVTAISEYMFSTLRITSADLPASITSIGEYAFNNCSVLQQIICRNPNPPTLDIAVCEDCDNLRYIYVPSSSLSNYKNASGWKTFNRENPDGENYFRSL